jgi:hypothetical protein
MVFTSITNIVVTLVAIALVDRLGRKPLLLIGSIGMAVMLGTMAYIFGSSPIDPATHQPVLDAIAGYVAIVAANLYVVFLGVSWGPVVWFCLARCSTTAFAPMPSPSRRRHN